MNILAIPLAGAGVFFTFIFGWWFIGIPMIIVSLAIVMRST